MDIEFKNHKITWESLDLPNESKIPDSLKLELGEIYWEMENPKSKTIDKIQKLIQKYPGNLQLKNYLSSIYAKLGNMEKAWAVNDDILKKHPDYLFAKINKANQYADEGQFEKMLELLGKGFDLQDLYPDRDTFHVSEFLSLQNVAVKYYANTGDFEQANIRLDIMADVDKDSLQYQQSLQALTNAFIQKAKNRLDEEEKLNIRPENRFRPNENSKPSELNFSESKKLYDYESEIPVEIINTILSLDRDKIIEDLENILKTSYFNYKKEENSFAPIHALFLLGELEAEESLPVVLEMMQLGEDYFNKVFGDIFVEVGWMPLLKIGKNQSKVFEDYLKLPGLHTYFRGGALDVLVQMIYHYPERKKEIVQIFDNVINFFTEAEIEDNVIDSELNGFFVAELVELKLEQFLPKIQILYEKRYVNLYICGTFEEVAKDIKNPKAYVSSKIDLLSIEEFYKNFFSPTDQYLDPKDDFFLSDNENFDYYTPHANTVIRSHEKIGRNDPCPCQSGKKFKKCCLGKGIYD